MPDASDEICGAPDRIDRATDGGVRLVQLRYLDSDRAASTAPRSLTQVVGSGQLAVARGTGTER